MNLTLCLQSELDKINSSVKLINSYNNVKINTEFYAFAENKDRFAHVSTSLTSNEYFLQIEDKELVTATLTTNKLNEIAEIIDFWLKESSSILSIQDKVEIDSFYYDLLVLTEKQILEKRWFNLIERIENKEIEFSFELIKEIKTHFWKLYPFFSHDFLWFSNIIGVKNHNFYTPIISSFNGNFEIRNEVYGKNVLFSSSVMNEIIQKLDELVKFNNEISKNPLK
ncbi:hypothetical protein [Sphingobacterium puteale]|uniref:hypothetical protein n=1 Tax=Sphingobacterium puteale TaxID=2420510 RepID=UPI0011C3C41C|nr:hypothetical protein [Sphingobacterium puteale]